MPRPSSSDPTALRMRTYRKRRRNGLRCLRVLLHDSEIGGLVEKGYLRPDRRGDPKAVQAALDYYVAELGPPFQDSDA